VRGAGRRLPARAAPAPSPDPRGSAARVSYSAPRRPSRDGQPRHFAADASAADEANRGHAAGLAILICAAEEGPTDVDRLDACWQHDAAICADPDLHDMVHLMFYLVTLISGIALVDLVNRTV
jgi:hypothetical protein